MVQNWAVTEKVPGRCVNSGPAITRRRLEAHVMQFKQNIIQILDARGEIIGTMKLPDSIKLTDLGSLKMLDAISVKVVPCSAPISGIIAGGVQ